jgi:two-component system OmpR family sensor kinase
MTSLRKAALIWTTILIALVATAAVLATRHVATVEVNKLLDNELQQIAINAGRGLSEVAQAPLQKTEIENRIAVQIWTAAGELVHQAPATDRLPRSTELGFSDIEFAGNAWRVFTAGDGDKFAQVAQRWSARIEIANHAAEAAAVPLLAALPIAWIAVILGIDRLLQRFAGFANALAQRSVDARDPIIPGRMPDEFLPIIGAINTLIDRHQLAVEQQKQFVSEAAHELRTPLAALQIQIDNLRAQPDVAARNEILGELSGGIRRASAMVGQLLKMARLDNPSPTKTEAAVDLRELMLSVVSEFVPASARSGVEIGMTFDEDFHARVPDADSRLLFANLIDNAIRYTAPGGNVDVLMNRANSDISVKIVDSGIGIPETALPRIFDRFYRAAPADIEGTGLGLAIARKIAERNNFRLTIANRQDRSGVLAQVLIPLSAA